MEEKKIPLWQIVCVICVMAFIATLVILSLIFSNEKWSFNAELVTLVSFIVIVCAGFFFDSVQIGKISLLKNEVKEKEAIISSLQNLISTSQISNNIVSPSFNINAGINESSQNKDELQKLKENEIISNKKDIKERKTRMEKAENKYLEKFCADKCLSKNELKENVRIDGIENLDSVSVYSPVFDYFYQFGSYSEFIVFKSVVSNSYLIKFQLYMMLSKIYNFNQFKNTKYSLRLILLQDTDKNSNDYENQIKQDFAPAFNSGLLRIEQIAV